MSSSLFEPQLFADDTGKQLPLALEDELFILERANVSFQAKAPTYVSKFLAEVGETADRK